MWTSGLSSPPPVILRNTKWPLLSPSVFWKPSSPSSGTKVWAEHQFPHREGPAEAVSADTKHHILLISLVCCRIKPNCSLSSTLWRKWSAAASQLSRSKKIWFLLYCLLLLSDSIFRLYLFVSNLNLAHLGLKIFPTCVTLTSIILLFQLYFSYYPIYFQICLLDWKSIMAMSPEAKF